MTGLRTALMTPMTSAAITSTATLRPVVLASRWMPSTRAAATQMATAVTIVRMTKPIGPSSRTGRRRRGGYPELVSGARFTRTREDFTCGNCGAAVRGNGYTNHCPRCLWSRHVDVDPGDRAADCGALMRPVGVLFEGDQHVLVH